LVVLAACGGRTGFVAGDEQAVTDGAPQDAAAGRKACIDPTLGTACTEDETACQREERCCLGFEWLCNPTSRTWVQVPLGCPPPPNCSED
jgi:hypothetical protein